MDRSRPGTNPSRTADRSGLTIRADPAQTAGSAHKVPRTLWGDGRPDLNGIGQAVLELKRYRPGIPRATYLPYPFRIFQSSSKIVMAYEFTKSSRTIHLNKKVAAPVPQDMGQSHGLWEGDTLVVEDGSGGGAS